MTNTTINRISLVEVMPCGGSLKFRAVIIVEGTLFEQKVTDNAKWTTQPALKETGDLSCELFLIYNPGSKREGQNPHPEHQPPGLGHGNPKMTPSPSRY